MTGLPYIPVYARDVYTWIMGKAVMACHRQGQERMVDFAEMQP